MAKRQKHSAADLERLGVTGKRKRTTGSDSTDSKQLAAFRKQLAVMPVEFLRCHVFGHSTYEATINPDGAIFVIGQVCYSCAMEIDRWRDPYTGKVSSRYWHPKGQDYYFHGTGRTTTERKLEIETAWRALVDLPEGTDQ